MDLKEGLELFQEYDGEITTTEDFVQIVRKDGAESWLLRIDERGSLRGEKKHKNSLYAGLGFPKVDRESVIFELHNYGFRKKSKSVEQLSIFDL